MLTLGKDARETIQMLCEANYKFSMSNYRLPHLYTSCWVSSFGPLFGAFVGDLCWGAFVWILIVDYCSGSLVGHRCCCSLFGIFVVLFGMFVGDLGAGSPFGSLMVTFSGGLCCGSLLEVFRGKSLFGISVVGFCWGSLSGVSVGDRC